MKKLKLVVNGKLNPELELEFKWILDLEGTQITELPDNLSVENMYH